MKIKRLAMVLIILLCVTAQPLQAKPATKLQGPLHRNSKFKARRISPKPKSIKKPTYPSRLIVKFNDDLKIRSAMGKLKSATPASISAIKNIRKTTAKWNIKYKPLIKLPSKKITNLKKRAKRFSGNLQPDLEAMFAVEIHDETQAQNIANAFLALPQVEFAYFQQQTPPPPGDIAPPTPDYFSLQTYHDPDPGIDMTYAWASGNGEGNNIQLADCEYGWNYDHEDLNDITIYTEPGKTIHPDVVALGYDSHGTAVIGQTSAVENGYGCTGLVPQAKVLTYPEWTVEDGYRRVDTIANAIADANLGDVVMLEMQTTGPGGDYAPAEVEQAVWTVVKAGTDAGVIVVAAAGNGDQNLDDAAHATYRSWGDSGAIIVGAGSANVSHDKLSFSSYGSRVNLQGWGQSVFTLGYGDYAELDGDKNQRYTDTFGSTSSATSIVAAACVSLQARAVEIIKRRLTPLEIRGLLIETATPQGSGGHIGPLPNLQAAIQWLESNVTYYDPFCPISDMDGDCDGDMIDLQIFLTGWLSIDPNMNLHGNAIIDFDDFAIFATQWPVDKSILPGGMIFIPSGNFEMGDHNDAAPDANTHTVYIDPFYMSNYEITNEQYVDYLNSAYASGQIKVDANDANIVYGIDDTNNLYPYCDTNSSSIYSQIEYDAGTFSVRTKGATDMSGHPMLEVSWCGAAAYCNWRSTNEGYQPSYDIETWQCDFSKKGYRLPTEAQWEYAARAGKKEPYYRFPWADTITHVLANYFSDSNSYSYDISITQGWHPTFNDGISPYTAPVGWFAPNAYGLYDMAGNVFEWCNDWYDFGFYLVTPSTNNPKGPISGTVRVHRGGAWVGETYNSKVSYRNFYTPGHRTSYNGFRVVLDLK